MMTREMMMDEVIRKCGLEHHITLKFCEIAETWVSDFAVENMFIIAMAIADAEMEE